MKPLIRYSLCGAGFCLIAMLFLNKSMTMENVNPIILPAQVSQTSATKTDEMPADEREYWMELIRDIDPDVYEVFQKANPAEHIKYGEVTSEIRIQAWINAPILLIGSQAKGWLKDARLPIRTV
jgi:hypothetical protein